MKYAYAAAQTPNGAAVQVHRLHRATLEQTRVLLTLNHYVDANQELPTWQDEYAMPVENFLMGQYPDCVWDWIVSSEGLFPGGQILEELDSLDSEKKKKTAAINSMRDGHLRGGYEIDGMGTFETDERSIQNILGAVQMAVICQMTTQPFAIDWRLADNSTASLQAAQMIAVGAALVSYVSAVYQRSWELKALVAACQSQEDLEQVQLNGWPLASNVVQPPPQPPE